MTGYVRPESRMVLWVEDAVDEARPPVPWDNYHRGAQPVGGLADGHSDRVTARRSSHNLNLRDNGVVIRTRDLNQIKVIVSSITLQAC